MSALKPTLATGTRRDRDRSLSILLFPTPPDGGGFLIAGKVGAGRDGMAR